MSIDAGSAWSATTREGKAYIQLTFDEVITTMIPQLKGIKFSLHYVDERTNEKAPDWRLKAYVANKKDNDASKTIQDKVKENATTEAQIVDEIPDELKF